MISTVKALRSSWAADADWDVGVPKVSERESVREARAAQEEIRKKQLVGV